ncbi:hypothetical protein Tco_0103008 [Tanacetum coccineum]
MLLIEILHDVVGTSGYHCGVLRSFPVERIEQGNPGIRSYQCVMDAARRWFKPVAYFGSRRKIEINAFCGMSIRLHQLDGVGSKRYHIVPYAELNGIPVALVARFGVISKSTDRICVSYGG